MKYMFPRPIPCGTKIVFSSNEPPGAAFSPFFIFPVFSQNFRLLFIPLITCFFCVIVQLHSTFFCCSVVAAACFSNVLFPWFKRVVSLVKKKPGCVPWCYVLSKRSVGTASLTDQLLVFPTLALAPGQINNLN